jgi:hypothetical protein
VAIGSGAIRLICTRKEGSVVVSVRDALGLDSRNVRSKTHSGPVDRSWVNVASMRSSHDRTRPKSAELNARLERQYRSAVCDGPNGWIVGPFVPLQEGGACQTLERG